MNKNLKLVFIAIAIFAVLIILFEIVYKNIKNGNNITSKSGNDLIEYILNISSYEAKLDVTINSNKTTNKYQLEQYYLEPNYSKQVVKKPENIENLEIIYDGRNLEIKNTNLGLNKVYENYNYLNQNILWLNFFTENCKKNSYIIEENNEEIILKNTISQYNYKGNLYISKKTNLPTKIEIKDNSNNIKIYIEYTEIKLNNIRKDNIFAFTTKDIKKEV